MKKKNTSALLIGAIMLFACTKEWDVNKKSREELSTLKTLELSYKDQTSKAVSQMLMVDELRAGQGTDVSADAYSQYARYMLEQVDFDPEQNMKSYLSSRGLSNETISIVTSLKEYLKNGNLMSTDDILKLNVPYSDKELLVQVFSSLAVALEYDRDEFRSSREQRVSDAINDCWEDYLSDLAVYTTVGAVSGATGGPIGVAIGGVGGVVLARYQLYKCLKQAKKVH